MTQTSTSNDMSDENKIRKQLLLDVRQFGSEVHTAEYYSYEFPFFFSKKISDSNILETKKIREMIKAQKCWELITRS